MKKLLLIFFALCAISLTYAQSFHKQWDIRFSVLSDDPPNLYNDYFAGAGVCLSCHNSQVDEQGNSVAILNDWRSTMMANAARDPFWQAKVSHETLVNPQLKTEIETVCIRCHAPMGSLEAFYNGEEHYSLEQMNANPLALDGVSCTVCHQITPASLGNYSGNFTTSFDHSTYGPYPNPFGNPMINNTGYTPVYSEHIRDSRLCASCHTLITNPVDLDGIPTGGEFVEQAPLQEWQNSIYPNQGSSCYTCHVPEIEDVVKISSTPSNLSGRSPFGKHHFAGANVFMLKLLKNNIDELSITADEVHFDSSINRTYQNLQLNTLGLDISEQNRTLDSLFLTVELSNMAGHKLPTAYPSRRVFVELYAISSSGDTIFHSGETDENFNIIDEDTPYEIHHNSINSSEQVQIYELVMGDVNGDYTTVLERSAVQLKDNRIPPIGFTSSHFSYDTTEIVGNALNDIDFNKTNDVEGSGMDKVHFNIPLNGNTNDIDVFVKVFYQTVSNKWLEDMFSYSSDKIENFRSMYNEADKSPILLANSTFTSTYIGWVNYDAESINIYPNPTTEKINVSSQFEINSINVYSITGELIKSLNYFDPGTKETEVSISNEKGIYLLVVKSNKHTSANKIIVR